MRQESRVPNRAMNNTNDAEVEKQITEAILKFLKDSFPQIQDEIQIEQVELKNFIISRYRSGLESWDSLLVRISIVFNN